MSSSSQLSAMLKLTPLGILFEHKLAIYAILVSIVMVILIIVLVAKSEEHMQSYYLDQIAMQSTDPAYVKFVGRERDPLGMSMRDYYVEHSNNANNLVEADYADDQMYYNTTGYLQMPLQYRPAPGEIFPKTLSRYVQQADNVVAQQGESKPESPIVVEGRKAGLNNKTDKVDNKFLN